MLQLSACDCVKINSNRKNKDAAVAVVELSIRPSTFDLRIDDPAPPRPMTKPLVDCRATNFQFENLRTSAHAHRKDKRVSRDFSRRTRVAPTVIIICPLPVGRKLHGVSRSDGPAPAAITNDRNDTICYHRSRPIRPGVPILTPVRS